MVLDLRVPADPRPAALLKMWPTFLSYFVSYLLIAIYWVNHTVVFNSGTGFSLCPRSRFV
jgi:uncharacterized membrane protein